MATVWVVVAESSRARIFTLDRPTAPLREQEDYAHPSARMKTRDLISDQPGTTFDRGGAGRHAMAPDTDPKRQEAVEFAKEIAGRIESARTAGEIEKLVLIAAPAFLGLLRNALTVPARRLVTDEVQKNLVRHDPDVIRTYVAGAR